jgi:hypothetical protein
MSIEGLIAAAVIVFGLLLYVGYPFARRERTTDADRQRASRQQDRLLMVYERVLTNIRDLDEDHRTGKMQTEDYEGEREQWVQRGIQVLKALDTLDAAHLLTSADDDASIDRAIDARIEAVIAARRGASS